MRKTAFAAILTFWAAFAFAQGNYYNAVLDLTGQPLYTALHALISTNSNSSYDGSKAEMFQDLDNVNGNVTCIYTGQVYNVGYNYTGSTDPNTEHTYAQSWFSSPESSVKKADLHHLFPSNSVVNSSRGNLPFFTVASHATANVYYNTTPWQSFRGPNTSGIQVFEPCDHSKGDIARALLYFNTRYYDTLTQQNVNMIPDLIQWHFADPPDATEITRNQGIYEFQTNRNPYVDHPEFVSRIWGGSPASDDSAPAVPVLALENVYPNPFSSSVTFCISSKDPAAAEISVFDARGRKLRSWTQALDRGTSELSWDGNGSTGQRLPAGLYLVRISAAGEILTAKILSN